MIKNKNTDPIIFGIDTSCDETSAGIVQGTSVLGNAVSSQIELHRKYGGVVPGLARRLHAERIDFVISEAFKLAAKNSGKKITWDDISALAVTYGPGLAIALEVGVAKAKELAGKYRKPLIAVNHMEGHLLSSLAANSAGRSQVILSKKDFPALGVLISGKHTDLVLMDKIGHYRIIGETLDDAIGEAYDKVARMLGLGYPGGAVVTELAKKGDPLKFKLPVPMEKHASLNFSYSGLKTAVYYLLKSLEDKGHKLNKKDIEDIAASFEFSAITELQIKLEQALKIYPVKTILVGGGVVGSAKVRAGIRKIAAGCKLPVYFPFDKKLHQDNAAMIAVAGYYKFLRKEFSGTNIDRDPRARL